MCKGLLNIRKISADIWLPAKKCLIPAIWVLSLLQAGPSAFTQNLIVANPAEVKDFRAAFVNPALIAYQESHAALGGKVFHLGFVEGRSNPFRQGYVSLVLPTGINNAMGLGLQAQYFTAPLYRQSNISFLMSRRWRHKVAFGIRVNLFSRSYNEDEFDLVDPDDPVFRNGTTQWAGTLGAGVAILPLPFLSLGIGVDHINRANISLAKDDVYQPLHAHFGAAIDFGPAQATFSSFYEDGHWLPKASVSTTFRHTGYAMFGYSDNAFQAEGQFRLSGPLSLNYNYEYTLFDSQGIGQGSHAMTLIHEFDRKREVQKFELPDEFRAEFQPPDRSLTDEATFYVYSVIDKLEIVEKRIARVVDAGVTAAQLSQLTVAELGVMDSSRTETKSPYRDQPVDLARIPATLDATLSENYREFLDDISDDINDNAASARVITPKESFLRAAGIRRYFKVDSVGVENLAFHEPVYKSRQDSLLATEKLGTRAIIPQETLLSLSPEFTTFQITPVSQVLPRKWRLLLKDQQGRDFRVFEGMALPPAQLRWDWRDVLGNLAEPGVYSYQLEWWDRDDQMQSTLPKYIDIQKLLRHIRIEISNKPKDRGVETDEIDIILKR